MIITILNRTTKTAGEIRLRFRLRDGRGVDLTHRSNICASLKELEKFNTDGTPRKQVQVYNRELAKSIKLEVEQMRKAYGQMIDERTPPYTGKLYAAYMEHTKHPEISVTGERCDIISRYEKFCIDGARDGVSESRARQYGAVKSLLKRFLIVSNKIDILPCQFSPDDLMLFREYIREEYKYTTTHPELFAGVRTRDVPKVARGANSVAHYMSVITTFFNDLQARGEIIKTPFDGLTKERRRKALRQKYNKPVYLYADEFAKIRAAAVPEDMKECKDMFLLQCALGCRIGDFAELKMQNISISPAGFAYIHYLPQKTKDGAANFEEIKTPLVLFALDIVKRTELHYKLRTQRERMRYNKGIQELLKFCGIDRECTIYNEETGQNEYVQFYTIASSKTARKTHIDMLTKVQVNMYAAGLHKVGSEAVQHYTELTDAERYKLLCAAFDEPQYKTDNELNITTNNY